MTNVQHTPGPWKARRPERNTGNVTVKAGDVTVALAVCADWGYEQAPDRSTAQSNAMLIAAAPVLLEALEDLLADIEQLANDFTICAELAKSSYGRAARAAIASAKGGAQ